MAAMNPLGAAVLMALVILVAIMLIRRDRRR